MASSSAITTPAPIIEVKLPPVGKWAREYQAFRRLLPELLKTHRGQFVAIHEGKVVANGHDKLTVALEALRQVGNVPIHVGLVSEEGEPVVRCVSPRLAHREQADDFKMIVEEIRDVGL